MDPSIPGLCLSSWPCHVKCRDTVAGSPPCTPLFLDPSPGPPAGLGHLGELSISFIHPPFLALVLNQPFLAPGLGPRSSRHVALFPGGLGRSSGATFRPQLLCCLLLGSSLISSSCLFSCRHGPQSDLPISCQTCSFLPAGWIRMTGKGGTLIYLHHCQISVPAAVSGTQWELNKCLSDK